MTGRPSIRNEAKIEEILERVTAGEPLAQVLRSEGMPKPSTFYDWLNADADLAGRFARAREFGADAIAVEALRLADVPPAYATSEGGTRIDAGDVANRKLQIETRLKLLAKWDPKRYGDKLELAGDAKAPLTVQVVKLTDAGQ